MGCVSKYGLITINFFVVCLGLSVVATSAAILRQNTIFGVVLTNAFYTVPLTSLLSGIFITCHGVVGCLGAIKEHPCLLRVYAGVVVLLLLVVLTVGISLLVFSANLSGYIVRGMVDEFEQYGEEGSESLTENLDILQHTTHCCGVYGYEDWEKFPYQNGTSVADGCCRNMTEGCGLGMMHNPNVTDLVYTGGCLSFVINAFDAICLALGILTFGLACFQALSITWACIIAKDSRRYQHLNV